jgi:VWFA-related protein
MVCRGNHEDAEAEAFAGETNRMRKPFCAALLLCCAWITAGAQRRSFQISPLLDSSPDSSPINQRQDLATTEVPALYQRFVDPKEGVLQLDVTVTDASGKPISGLDQGDFTLLDNGKPTKILTFHASDPAAQKPDEHTELILVLDQLYLNYLNASQAEKVLDLFLHQNGGHLALPTTIYRLTDDGLSVTSHPSTDGNALAAEISDKKGMRPVAWNKTAFYFFEDKRILLHASTLGSIAIEARKVPGRKLVVWIGYGWPLAGAKRDSELDEITELSTRLREARIALYRVNAWFDPKVNDPEHSYDYRKYIAGVENKQDASAANYSLEVLATQSGGAVYGLMQAVNGSAPLDKIAPIILEPIARILAENSASYSLSFDPPRTQAIDEYHDLKVEIRKPDLVAHTRAGYYNEPVNFEQPRAIPPQQLSVAQLEQKLAQTGHGSQFQLDLELSNSELTERMSSARLNAWKSRLHNKKVWQALVALADSSAFLNLPTAEIPALPKPTLAEQKEQFMRIVRYLSDLTPKLPSLEATRTTDRYEEPKLLDGQTWKTARIDRSLHLETSDTVTIRYINGEDFIESGSGKDKKAKKGSRYLETKGTFGGILSLVLFDATNGKITWGGWESGESGPLAVFRYSVPENLSHYHVSTCCYPEDLGGGLFRRQPAYHGSIAFDPATGAILRLTVQPELSEKLPATRGDIVIEYAPVKIGDGTYLCPVKSITIMPGRTLHTISEWGGRFQFYGPIENMLIDVSFSNYHRFGSTARILTDVQEAP